MKYRVALNGIIKDTTVAGHFKTAILNSVEYQKAWVSERKVDIYDQWNENGIPTGNKVLLVDFCFDEDTDREKVISYLKNNVKPSLLPGSKVTTHICYHDEKNNSKPCQIKEYFL